MRPGREAGFRPDGGCGFPLDPAADAAQAAYFWRPEVAPAVVIQLAPAPPPAARTLNLADLAAHARTADDGTHVVLRNGLQLLLLSGASFADPLSAVLPFDADLPARLAATEALYALVTRGRTPPDALSEQRRTRLKKMLRALDGRVSAASYRHVAQQLVGDVDPDSSAWRTSSVRDVTIRLCRSGGRLMRGGYLALLRKRR